MSDPQTDTAVRPPSPWFALAAGAFHAAQRRDLDEAANLTKQITEKHGPDCLPQVMLAWIDTTLKAIGATTYDGPAALQFLNVDTGEETGNSNDLSPHTAWAARLINTRLADDEAGFNALLDAAMTTPRDWASHVLALLSCCAITTSGGRQNSRADIWETDGGETP